MNQIKSDVPSRKDLEKLQQFVEESHDPHRGKEGQNYQLQLTSIEKQRREWEEAREKAEAMSQIFDSLIITSKYKGFIAHHLLVLLLLMTLTRSLVQEIEN